MSTGGCTSEDLQRKLDKLEHIRMMEYTHEIGAYRTQRAAVFDDRLVSGEEVKNCIVHGECYHPCIIYMDMKQFENVFRYRDPEENI